MHSAEGADPSAAGGDWRVHLQPQDRRRIVNQIMELLNKRSPLELPSVLQNVAQQFEQKIYTAATTQADYFEGIPRKMLLIDSETNIKQNPGNAQVTPNQRPPVPAYEDSTAQTDYPGPGDWQEELYQMIKTLKNQYQPEISDLYNKVSMKLQYIDNHMPAQKVTELYEKIKNFKLMLDRTLMFLNIDKNSVQLSLKEKIPLYERQIVSILKSRKRKPVQTFEQSAGQAPSSNTSSIPVKLPAQTGYSGAGDLHELSKTLKNQYLAGLGDLYEISMKLLVDNHTMPQETTNRQEEVKSFKSMLEHSLHSLEIKKSCVQPSVEESMPMYKRQILSILNSEEWAPEKKFQQSAGQAPSTSSSGTQHAHGTLPQERSNVKRLRPSLKDDIGS
ncbi:hypothetical protein EJB05_47202 [Eragrostis curvula]|uniref:Mediator complex subunit 15 KIX domain-containing protein n=1 Tax=Eragrostis curvula TaxID=38414 RepID=A0A5J9T6X1_9POAL|nr:hypothetical protein EJB05_47202 [Eragrostis curvula]